MITWTDTRYTEIFPKARRIGISIGLLFCHLPAKSIADVIVLSHTVSTDCDTLQDIEDNDRQSGPILKYFYFCHFDSSMSMIWWTENLSSHWFVADNNNNNNANALLTTTFVWGAMVLVIVCILSTSTSLPQRLKSIFYKAMSIVYLRYLLWKQLQKTRLKKKGDENENDDDTVVATVSGIYIHPVKSMRAISLSESLLDSAGLPHDREFMVVYELPLPPYMTKWEDQDTTTAPTVPRYRFLTQRQCPVLATITATLTEKEQPNKLNLQVTTSQTNRIKSSIEIPLTGLAQTSRTITTPANTTPATTTPRHFFVGIWDDTILVEDMGDEVAAFLQAIVNGDKDNDDNDQSPVSPDQDGSYTYTVRLVRQVSNNIQSYRSVDPKLIPSYAKTWWGVPPPASLTDGYPLLIATEASLQGVNEQLTSIGKPTIPMSRFRPNIVLKSSTSAKAFDEDQWKVIAIGNHVLLAIVKACPRCKQCCTDQLTGTVTEEPVQIMKTFRALADNNNKNKDVFFAQNAISFGGGLGGMQSIRVGDPVRVLKRGDPIYM